MQPVDPSVRHLAGTVLFLLAIATHAVSASGTGRAVSGDSGNLPYTISFGDSAPPEKPVTKEPDLSGYTVESIRKRIPATFTGKTARTVPRSLVDFLPNNNLADYIPLWEKAGRPDPPVIILGRGSYSLDTVHAQIQNPELLEKIGEQEFLLKTPLYIAPTASLVIHNGAWLKMSIEHGSYITYQGDLLIADARVTSWDIAKQNSGVREKLAKEDIRTGGVQQPRPFLLGLNGSRSYFTNSSFLGLGYQGSMGTYGISLVNITLPGTNRYLKHRDGTGGEIIGNTIDDFYFGFFTNRASHVAYIGNVLRNNAVYAIDPHDYSDHLIIARNITYGSGLAHGIIFSRNVVNSVITENISFKNAGSGIMLDRQCSDVSIYRNLAFNNHGDGIALLESSQNAIYDNETFGNGNNGIYIRNSSDVTIEHNIIAKNAVNGVELSVVNLDHVKNRNFVLDPYRKHASASLLNNIFNDNTVSAISAKRASGLSLFNNRFIASGPSYFSGDLKRLAPDLLRNRSKYARLVRIDE